MSASGTLSAGAEVRVGIIGAGKMARAHLETLRAIDGVLVCGITSRTPARADDLARTFGIDRIHGSTRDLCDAVDAVIVAVSHEATADVTADVLASGRPCLIEKPAAFSSAEVEHLARLGKGSLAMVAVNRRFYSTISLGMLSVLQHGPIRAIHVEAHEPISSYRGRREFSSWVYDRWLLANTIHMIDLLRMLGGEVTALSGFASSDGGPSYSAALRLGDGITGTFASHWNSAPAARLSLFGEGVRVEFESLVSAFVTDTSGLRLRLRPDRFDSAHKPGLYAQDLTFLRAVATREVSVPAPGSDLADHARTLALAEAIRDLPLARGVVA